LKVTDAFGLVPVLQTQQRLEPGTHDGVLHDEKDPRSGDTENVRAEDRIVYISNTRGEWLRKKGGTAWPRAA